MQQLQHTVSTKLILALSLKVKLTPIALYEIVPGLYVRVLFTLAHCSILYCKRRRRQVGLSVKVIRSSGLADPYCAMGAVPKATSRGYITACRIIVQ